MRNESIKVVIDIYENMYVIPHLLEIKDFEVDLLLSNLRHFIVKDSFLSDVLFIMDPLHHLVNMLLLSPGNNLIEHLFKRKVTVLVLV
jgi:hypothetical protein